MYIYTYIHNSILVEVNSIHTYTYIVDYVSNFYDLIYTYIYAGRSGSIAAQGMRELHELDAALNLVDSERRKQSQQQLLAEEAQRGEDEARGELKQRRRRERQCAGSRPKGTVGSSGLRLVGGAVGALYLPERPAGPDALFAHGPVKFKTCGGAFHS